MAGNAAMMEEFVASARAGNVFTVRELLQSPKVKVDGFDSTGESALVAAAMGGHTAVVQALLAAGANAVAPNELGYLALGGAAYHGASKAMALLLDANAEIDTPGPGMYRPLTSAAWKGHANAVELLVRRGAQLDVLGREGLSPLHWACEADGDQKKYVRVVQALLAGSADVNRRTTSGHTAALIAAKRGKANILDALIEAGADVNASEPMFGYTALMEAAWHGRRDCVTTLIAAQADVNIHSINGTRTSALIHACERGFAQIAVDLILAGADTTHCSKRRNKSPLQLAIESGSRPTANVVRFFSPQPANATAWLLKALDGPAYAFLHALTSSEWTRVMNQTPVEIPCPSAATRAMRSKIKVHLLAQIKRQHKKSLSLEDVRSEGYRSNALADLAPVRDMLHSLCDEPFEAFKEFLPHHVQHWTPPKWMNEAVIGGIADTAALYFAKERAALRKDPERVARYQERARILLLDNLHIYVAALEMASKKHGLQAELLRRDAAAKKVEIWERYPARPVQPGLGSALTTVYDLKLQAARAFPAFATFINELARDTGTVCSVAHKLKGSFRITEKQSLRGSLGSICDVVRALATAADFDQMLDVHRRMFHFHEAGRIEIVDFKDRLNHPTSAGWADLVYLFRVNPEGPDGQHGPPARKKTPMRTVQRSVSAPKVSRLPEPEGKAKGRSRDRSVLRTRSSMPAVHHAPDWMEAHEGAAAGADVDSGRSRRSMPLHDHPHSVSELAEVESGDSDDAASSDDSEASGPLHTGHICELQLVLQSMLTARRGMDGHKTYAEARHIVEALKAVDCPLVMDDDDRLSATEIRREVKALRQQVKTLGESQVKVCKEKEALAEENARLRAELARAGASGTAAADHDPGPADK